jgi:hypothetical protein
MPAKKTFLFFILVFFILAGFSMAQAASLTTTFAGGNGQDGNMFEISALKTVIIRSFDGNLDPPSDDYRIYYKAGTYTGFEDDPGAWTLVGTATNVTSNGENTPTPIPIDIDVTIPGGQTYSFYVTTEGAGSGVGYTDGTSEHAVYVSDANIEIREGIGIQYPFDDTYSPRVWNGTVYYDLAGPATPIPTMNEWGMIIFSLLLAGSAIWMMRRRQIS